MKTLPLLGFSLPALVLLLVGFNFFGPVWTVEELAAMRELRLDESAPAPDPTNQYADDAKAAKLGHRFFFDTRFSSNGAVACATCHLPTLNFQDGAALAKGVGSTNRRTMPLAGIASAPWFFWDGRKDSLWSQALGPLESPVEHGGDRTQYVHAIVAHYREEYERAFGSLPILTGVPAHASPNGTPEAKAVWNKMSPAQREAVNGVFANMGKAIAAYERKLGSGVSRFDRYVDAILADDDGRARKELTRDEEEGLFIFLGKGNCTQCHSGPQFTNNDFANVATPVAPGLPDDTGRMDGARKAQADEFNCLGKYSDAKPDQCGELRHLHADAHALRKFKVPGLRNVAERAPYMHAGQFASLEQVLDHYNRAPTAPSGESELKPLALSRTELKQLAMFLGTLSAPLAADPVWLEAPR